MLKEASNPKYQADGFYVRNFNIFPNGERYEDLDDYQKTFYMYLAALSPSIEALEHYCRYEVKRQEIEEADYADKIDQPEEVIATTAEYLGITAQEYKKRLAQQMKEKDLMKLKEKYGMITEDEKEEIEKRKKQIEKKIERKIEELTRPYEI